MAESDGEPRVQIETHATLDCLFLDGDEI